MSDPNPTKKRQIMCQTYSVLFQDSNVGQVYISVPFRVGRIITKQVSFQSAVPVVANAGIILTARSSLIGNQSHGTTSSDVSAPSNSVELIYSPLNPLEINGTYVFVMFGADQSSPINAAGSNYLVITLQFEEIY